MATTVNTILNEARKHLGVRQGTERHKKLLMYII